MIVHGVCSQIYPNNPWYIPGRPFPIILKAFKNTQDGKCCETLPDVSSTLWIIVIGTVHLLYGFSYQLPFSCILAMFSFLATLFTLGNSNSYHFAVKLEIECHSYLNHYRFFCCYEKVGCCWFSSNNYSRLFEQLNVLYFDGVLQCLIETSLILTLMIRIWKEEIKMNQQAFVETQYEGCISIYWLIDSLLSFLDVSSKFCPIIIAMHIGNSNANQDMVCLLLKRWIFKLNMDITGSLKSTFFV